MQKHEPQLAARADSSVDWFAGISGDSVCFKSLDSMIILDANAPLFVLLVVHMYFSTCVSVCNTKG